MGNTLSTLVDMGTYQIKLLATFHRRDAQKIATHCHRAMKEDRKFHFWCADARVTCFFIIPLLLPLFL